MATALARPLAPAPTGRGRGIAPVALRVARPDEVDLDAAWHDATGPHRAARAAADAPHGVDHVAPVIPLRTSARVRRNRVRAVLVALGLALVLAMGAGMLGGSGADADGPTPVGATVTVQPGQTLWDVAAGATPAGGDVRATLDELRDLNGLAGDRVPAWTPVVLPAD